MNIFSQSYDTLWKQFSTAESKDQPRTQIEILQKIIAKAQKERQYGHLLKAELLNVGCVTSITPDSLSSKVARLVEQEKAAASDPVLSAIYQSVLGTVYQSNPSLDEQSAEISRDYYRRSLSNPALLAAHQVPEFKPLMTEGPDSKYFNDDLLHVLGMRANDYQTLHDYYESAGMLEASCLTACELQRGKRKAKDRYAAFSPYVKEIDSLISRYEHAETVGELAVLRYEYMADAKDVTVADQIKYIDESLAKWGNWKRLNVLRNAREELTFPMFDVEFGCPVTPPNKERVLKIRAARHINTLKMTVSRVNLTAEEDYYISHDDVYAKVKKAIVKGSEQTFERQFAGKESYEIVEDSLVMPGLPAGMYLVEFTADRPQVNPYRLLYFVSDVYVLSEGLPEDKIRLAVVSATTGQPIPKANVKLDFNYRWGKKDPSKIVTLACDAKGETVYQQTNETRGRYNIFAYASDDKYCPSQDLWTSYSASSTPRDRFRASLYTDRSIYRPGQTVHVAAVLMKVVKGLTTSACASQTITITLRDANSKEIGSEEVITDEFGKAYAEFKLPESGLTGEFSLSCDYSSYTRIRVEEYKRPTFEVEIPEVKEEYRPGDILEVKGYAKTYSGVPVQGAQVEYTVSRRQALWWWWHTEEAETLIEETAVTGDDGSFTVRVPFVMPDDYDPEAPSYLRSRFYNFIISAQVTDQGGETHEGSLSLPLGTRATVLSCNIPQQMIADSVKTISFGYRNAAGASVDSEVTYTIDGNAKKYQARTNTPVDFSKIARSLKSGEHVIKAVCGTDTIEQKFVLFSLSDKRPCIETHDWYYVTAREFAADGSPVYLQVGSSDPNTHVLYSIIADNKVLESGSFRLDNAIKTYQFKYQEAYGSGLLLTFAWVRDGVAYTHQTTIRRPMPDKRVLLQWTTFRDRLTPGQSEEWTMRATRPDGSPADVSVIAAMYDRSLDQIWRHEWSFDPGITVSLPSTRWQVMNFGTTNVYGRQNLFTKNVPSLDYSAFDYQLFEFWRPRIMFHKSRMMGAGGVRYDAAPMMEEMATAEVADMASEDGLNTLREVAFQKASGNDAEQKEEAVEETDTSGESVQLRENLSETAFFYPTLTSSADGSVYVKFTLPESVTTWRVMGLATDKVMNYGLIEGETVAKKDVMIQPNMPRFVRVGDEARISARILNTSERDISGTARMTLVDPVTGHTIYTKSQPYQVVAGQTTSVAFDYSPEGDGTLLVCRMVAEGDGFSDGEQHYLPILPDKELVTRTYPFSQNGAQTTTVSLDRLFPKGISDGKLTIEYTNNPAWLMIQTLPTLGLSNSDNAISVAASFYANSLSHYLLHLSPQTKATIDSWRNEEGEENSMMSSLAKNEELKDLLLNETPWVGDADREESQKRSLVKFFDETTMDLRLSSAIEKLSKLQQSDGSWSWWPGMRGSRYMTVAVSEMLVRLNQMIGKQEQVADMLTSAFEYLGEQQVEEEKEMRKWEKKGHRVMPSETALRTLYTFALDGRKLPGKVDAANTYMVDKIAKKPSEFTIYGKANSAVILAAYGRQQKASEYLKSLREYSVVTEEMGRYFDTRKAQYSWFSYAIPTEVAAIEAIKRLQPEDTQTVDEMRRWLLQEKRTQSWDTPINTVDAVYAFLEGHIGELGERVETTLAIDGKTVEMPKATAGLGYVKTSMTADGKQTFEARKTSDGTSWGALYAQFMQPVKDVEKHSAGISVTREIRSDSKVLHVGDKVKVRITIKADRDYDFVEVIDRRAACMEPVEQLSGYHYGYYIAPKDYTTCYYFDQLGKGTHVLETEYYIDRQGTYETGTCKVQCAYSPEYSATGKALTVTVE